MIDGGARDIDYILKLGFPVFCRYRTPADVVGRWKRVSYGLPIQIGEVGIRRGDFIVGDKDGVLVIPKQITLEVLDKSEELVNTENLVRKAILQGVHPVSLPEIRAILTGGGKKCWHVILNEEVRSQNKGLQISVDRYQETSEFGFIGVVRKPLSRSLRLAMGYRSVLNRRLFEGLIMSIKTIHLTRTFTVEHT